MNKRLALCCLFPVAINCGVNSAQAIGPAPTWQTRQTVATAVSLSAHVGADRALAFDHHGNAGVAFSKFSGIGNILYARNSPGTGWQSTIVDPATGGTWPSLAFDRYERPVVAYAGWTNNRPRVANFNGTAWNAQYADAVTGNSAEYVSLALDSTGKMALAYRDSTATRFKYVKDTDGDSLFSDEVPIGITFDDIGYYATLAFDPLDRPMISTYDGVFADLKFSALDTGLGWSTVTVDSANFTGGHSSMAIDPDNGYPAISYLDETGGDLRYAAWDGATWVKTTIDSPGVVGWYTSLAFDPADGNPAISYYDQTNGDLKLAWFDGTNWQKQVVDSIGNVGVTTSLAFNDFGNGFPAIVYGDSSNNLYFIEDPPASVPEPQTVLLLAFSVLIGSSWYRWQRAAEGIER